jgi:uncharacterized protein (DUF427 family)
MASTTETTATPAPQDDLILGRMTLEPAGKRLRAVFNGAAVAESTDALILHETGCPPRVYFPPADVSMDLLKPTARTSRCPWKGRAAYWTLTVAGKTRENAAWAYPEPLPELAAIKNYLSFYEDVALEG